MHVREMVEDVFNIGFFTTKMATSLLVGHLQSDRKTELGASVCHRVLCLCQVEQNRTMHVREMVGYTFKEQNSHQSAILVLILKKKDVHV